MALKSTSAGVSRVLLRRRPTSTVPSPAVTRHFRAAHPEVLRGPRAILDEQIAAQTDTRPHGQGTKIQVD